VGPLRLGMTKEEVERVCQEHRIGHSGATGPDGLQVDFHAGRATRIEILAEYPFARLSLAGQVLPDVSDETIRRLLAKIIPLPGNWTEPEASGLAVFHWELSDTFVFSFRLFLPGYRTIREDGTPVLPAPVRPPRRVSASFSCDACARTAAVATTTPSMGLLDIDWSPARLEEVVPFAQRQRVLQAVKAASPAALFAVNEAFAPFYCPACQKSYCREHWRFEAAGSEDAAPPLCPRGHHRTR